MHHPFESASLFVTERRFNALKHPFLSLTKPSPCANHTPPQINLCSRDVFRFSFLSVRRSCRRWALVRFQNFLLLISSPNLLSLLFPSNSHDAQCPASCCCKTATTQPPLTAPLKPFSTKYRPTPAPSRPAAATCISSRKSIFVSDCQHTGLWTPLNAQKRTVQKCDTHF